MRRREARRRAVEEARVSDDMLALSGPSASVPGPGPRLAGARPGSGVGAGSSGGPAASHAHGAVVAAVARLAASGRDRLVAADPGTPQGRARLLLRPLPWMGMAYLSAGVVVGVAGLALPLLAVLATVGLVVSWVGVPMWSLTVRALHVATCGELARLRLATGLDLPAPHAPVGVDRRARVESALADPATWRRLGFWVLRAPIAYVDLMLLGAVVGVPFLLAWASLLSLFDHNDVVMVGGPAGASVWVPAPWPVRLLLLTVSLAALRVVPPLVVRPLLALDVLVARALLAAGEEARLAVRVDELATSRERAVDAAEKERARIERDLHDGAQQRLVALTMLLGRAQARLGPTADPAVAGLLTEAREETTAAIAELRDLTRGLHPPVLTDRGLDAALSAVAARSPVPVTVDVDVDPRPAPAIEAVLYFAVCEGLTNIAKHSQARRASVVVERVPGLGGGCDVVRAIVADDGCGGANQAAGSGLAGLADRLAGVDGRLALSSPPGGPTLVTVEVPCASS